MCGRLMTFGKIFSPPVKLSVLWEPRGLLFALVHPSRSCSKHSTVTLRLSEFPETDLLAPFHAHCHPPPSTGFSPRSCLWATARKGLPWAQPLMRFPAGLSSPQLTSPMVQTVGRKALTPSSQQLIPVACSMPGSHLCGSPHALPSLSLSAQSLVIITSLFQTPGEAQRRNIVRLIKVRGGREITLHTAHTAPNGDCGRDSGSKYLRNSDALLLCVECDFQMWLHLSSHLLS